MNEFIFHDVVLIFISDFNGILYNLYVKNYYPVEEIYMNILGWVYNISPKIQYASFGDKNLYIIERETKSIYFDDLKKEDYLYPDPNKHLNQYQIKKTP